MPKHILVANRGEIAIRILRTAADLGIETSAVFATDDEHALHTRHADHVHCLEAEGVQAYLDLAKLLDIAGSNKCDAIHPGYGFLSESPAFAAECEGAGFTFIGPTSETLKLFGDKAAARALAESC
ncbi:MAG TPA: carbamoyl-phosphate synthase large subunit, partial [Gammaproteobacteria bacterium]|nr:carbamoyl-phosphate synthase large subunit [Gammaproteobacteria bacterium]